MASPFVLTVGIAWPKRRFCASSGLLVTTRRRRGTASTRARKDGQPCAVAVETRNHLMQPRVLVRMTGSKISCYFVCFCSKKVDKWVLENELRK
jgi:hypothetical protein